MCTVYFFLDLSTSLKNMFVLAFPVWISFLKPEIVFVFTNIYYTLETLLAWVPFDCWGFLSVFFSKYLHICQYKDMFPGVKYSWNVFPFFSAEGTTYRDELMEKIIQICSQNDYQYITNFEWYISVLVDLTRMEGTSHGPLIAAQMMDVAIRVETIRPFAVEQMALLVENYHLLLGKHSLL